ncbi:MAG: phosphatidylglycerophosphatase A [Thermodesulfovibrionales bacterium]|nr:phosphatidylglycerophosphatase A [Thermodesulfovibrionales bacterium]
MQIYRSPCKIIATLFYMGYIPIASGTFGSFAAMLLVWITKPSNLVLLLTSIILFIIGVICAHITEKDLQMEDSPKIIIDEFVGYIVSIQFLPLTFGYLISAFILFRLFDIIKPVPIRWVERRFGGGMAIMIDDVVAGLMTNLIIQGWRQV